MTRVPFIPQMEAVECGAACLAMVLAHHGHWAPLVEIRQACSVGRDGASASAILRAARGLGLEAEAVKADLEDLKDLPLPAILHWDFNHFVVLERLTREGARLVDPSQGRLNASREDLDRHFTGVALVFAPSDEFRRRRRRRPSLRKYRDLAREALPTLGQILLHALMLQTAGLLFPVAHQILLDRVVLPRQETWLVGLGVALFAAWFAQTVLGFVRGWVIQSLQLHMDAQLMRRFVAHLLHLPLAFFLQRRIGDLLSRAGSLATLRNLFTSRSVSSLLDGLLVLAYGALMVAMEVRLGLLVLFLAAGRAALSYALRHRSAQALEAELAATGREETALLESLTALETLKACQAETRMVERWTARMVDRLNATLGRRRLELLGDGAMDLFQALSLALVTWMGGLAVVQDRITLGTYAAILALQALLGPPLESLLEALGQLQYLGGHLRRLDDVLESELEDGNSRPAPLTRVHASPSRSESGPGPTPLQGEVELEGVTFRYDAGAPPVLEDLNLKIRAGEKVALVGRSGAGKSTLARLLMGLHRPTAGTLRFDGVDLRAWNLQALRRRMGVVLQEPFLFDDTVRANLALQDPEASLDKLRRAAQMAEVLEVIEALPEGFETRLGENGSRLSGGQRQRLCLARALVNEPSLLLLDEATSALDLETETRVHANLALLGCTRLLIAHRLDTVRDADRILVVEEGQVVQDGSFESLSDAPGPFARLLQAREEAGSHA